MSFNRPLKTNGRESLKAVYTLYGKLLQIECVWERWVCLLCSSQVYLCLFVTFAVSFFFLHSWCRNPLVLTVRRDFRWFSQLIHFLGCWPTKGPESPKTHKTELVKLKLIHNFMCLLDKLFYCYQNWFSVVCVAGNYNSQLDPQTTYCYRLVS